MVHKNMMMRRRKRFFWKHLEAEVLESQKDGSGLMIFTDVNAWLGSDLIPNDPHN